ncbi:hypothetical protein NECAME_14786 [Necator americanus]|uniref:Uncharacterized protein n=1 Tax=Necator americanus TaxID=51031 RepID=W2SLC8_NECAM|nr:hypothetical protein NECAME_14786 [Necator americanus]ETN70415.1 hypothetical protein NECAME_14786 [Necator americanus]
MLPLEVPTVKSGRAAGVPTVPRSIQSIPHFEDVVQDSPRAGRLFADRNRRVKRHGCSICINGRPIIKRTKRSLDCVSCTYLQPTESVSNPFAAQTLPTSPVGIPPRHLRKKRAGCLPHPECTFAPRRVRRNLESQYCEPCTGGYYGRKKREAEIDKCVRREKRESSQDCEVDEFLVTRMKRQTYNPKGILDIVKVLSKTFGQEGPGGCVKFPACVLAQAKRRKRHAERMEQYHKDVASRIQIHNEKHSIRQKRQFFAPDASASCVPCPAWVTTALASRKKRSTSSSSEKDEQRNVMSLSEAIADIRSKAGYKLGFDVSSMFSTSREMPP